MSDKPKFRQTCTPPPPGARYPVPPSVGSTPPPRAEPGPNFGKIDLAAADLTGNVMAQIIGSGDEERRDLRGQVTDLRARLAEAEARAAAATANALDLVSRACARHREATLAEFAALEGCPLCLAERVERYRAALLAVQERYNLRVIEVPEGPFCLACTCDGPRGEEVRHGRDCVVAVVEAALAGDGGTRGDEQTP